MHFKENSYFKNSVLTVEIKQISVEDGKFQLEKNIPHPIEYKGAKRGKSIFEFLFEPNDEYLESCFGILEDLDANYHNFIPLKFHTDIGEDEDDEDDDEDD